MESRSASEEEGKKTLTTFSESSATPFSFFFHSVDVFFCFNTRSASRLCFVFFARLSLSLRTRHATQNKPFPGWNMCAGTCVPRPRLFRLFFLLLLTLKKP